MQLLVDTNAIVDVLYQDPAREEWSKRRMSENAGDLLINQAIYAELCYRAESAAEVERLVATLDRQRRGTKTAPLPDFSIGAHATAAGFFSLTRGAARYQTCFPSVRFMCPGK